MSDRSNEAVKRALEYAADIISTLPLGAMHPNLSLKEWLMRHAEAEVALRSASAPQPTSASMSDEARSVLSSARVFLDEFAAGGNTHAPRLVKRIDKLLKAPLSETPAGGTAKVPEGWKLVPVEPTQHMMRAVELGPSNARYVYRAMLAAAPSPDGNEEPHK